MKYDAENDYKHGSRENLGVLITNLGTPDEPSTKKLRTYLKDFLSDPRVIEIPKLLWQLVLRTIILNLRPKKSAKLYKSIWKKKSSPLLVMLEKQKKGIIRILKKKKRYKN